jgi:radical SAM superfamily enzyme YgiQ (UPF0313 family)
MGKGWNRLIVDYGEAVEKLRRRGIATCATFLFGYDEDDSDAFCKTLDFAVRQKFFLIAFNHLVPFPGTPLYHMFRAEGRLLYDRWWLEKGFSFGDVAFLPKNFSPDGLASACAEFRKRFYSPTLVLKRALDRRANCKDLFMAFTYFSLNHLFKKEVGQRMGLPIGRQGGIYTDEDHVHKTVHREQGQLPVPRQVYHGTAGIRDTGGPDAA